METDTAVWLNPLHLIPLRKIKLSAVVVIFILSAICFYYQYSNKEHPVPGKIPRSSFLYFFEEKYVNNTYSMTVVTMFLNLDIFQKGFHGIWTPQTYISMFHTWAFLNNTVIAFFDDDNTLRQFRSVRYSYFPPEKTILVKISREELPAFRDLATIQRIFAQRNDSKFKPKTVMAEYSCTVNAKYDVIETAVSMRVIDTKYIAWADISLFGSILEKNSSFFSLEVPEKFDDSTMAYTQVKHFIGYPLIESPRTIINSNIVWMKGNFFVGTTLTMWYHVQSYRRGVQDLLTQGIFSTDHHVLASMYSHLLTNRPSVKLSLYQCKKGQYRQLGVDTALEGCLPLMCRDSAHVRAHSRFDTNQLVTDNEMEKYRIIAQN